MFGYYHNKNNDNNNNDECYIFFKLFFEQKLNIVATSSSPASFIKLVHLIWYVQDFVPYDIQV